MQANKLQELTDKLYQEGLSKGKQEADELLAKAKTEEKRILTHAREEAERIITAAKKEAEKAKATSESEIRLASRQTMASVKQAIENMIITKALAEPVKSALNEKAFLQELILAAAGKFDTHQTGPLSLLLPEDMQKLAKEEIEKQLAGNIDITFTKNIKSGFKLGPKAGGYHIDFTDEAFQNLFSESLRPHIRKLLFAE
jgi:V/A-type H+-transporting ATPase subunit E